MKNEFYTAEQISELLGIHLKTVQRYIREGKIRASKIGKSWRVSGHDLSAFTESADNSAKRRKEIAPEDRIKISSVIDIELNSRDEATALINTLNAALNTKPPEYGRSTLYTQYIEEERKLRLTLWGNAPFTEVIIALINTMVKHFDEE